jgi:hypothetical protein
LPVAIVTFWIFAVEEFNHGYRFKNIVKQLTYSFATATMIILDQHRFAVHDAPLAEFGRRWRACRCSPASGPPMPKFASGPPLTVWA